MDISLWGSAITSGIVERDLGGIRLGKGWIKGQEENHSIPDIHFDQLFWFPYFFLFFFKLAFLALYTIRKYKEPGGELHLCAAVEKLEIHLLLFFFFLLCMIYTGWVTLFLSLPYFSSFYLFWGKYCRFKTLFRGSEWGGGVCRGYVTNR